MAETENFKSELDHDEVILHWETPEFIRHPKGPLWYMIAGILIIGLIIYAIYTDSATMAIVFIVLAGVYYLTHNRDPRIIDIAVTRLGIYAGQTFYPYNMINSFWVVYQPPFVHTLNIKLSNKGGTKVTIQLNEQNPTKVRQTLSKEIPEVEGVHESVIDILIRLLRL